MENQLLVKLKMLSSYCIQLNTSYIPWQKLPEALSLENLKAELLNNHNPEQVQEIRAALSCCDEVSALLRLHHLVSTDDLHPEEMQSIEENSGLNMLFLATEENTEELLGSYIPQLLGPGLNELISSIPESHNPFILVSSSLMTMLRKILITVGGSSVLTIASSRYCFTSLNAPRTLLELSMISGMSAIGLCYQQQTEEYVKEVLQTCLELTCAYAGMLFFKTDESFRGYLHKIIPALAASKITECGLDYRESYTVTSFILPLLVSSVVYNRDFILETYQQFKTIKKAKEQFLQPLASLITQQILHSTTNKLSQMVILKRGINRALSTVKCNPSLKTTLLTSAVLWTIPSLKDMFTPEILPMINQLFNQPTEQLTLHALNLLADKFLILFKEGYLTILQQDDMQKLLLEIQKKLDQLDPEVEELKNQFLKKVFFNKTGKDLPLDNAILDVLKKLSGVDMQASLFASLKDSPSILRLLWNSYPYPKKVAQTLMLEILLQGFIISCLVELVPKLDTAPKYPFSYLKTADLGIKLIL